LPRKFGGLPPLRPPRRGGDGQKEAGAGRGVPPSSPVGAAPHPRRELGSPDPAAGGGSPGGTGPGGFHKNREKNRRPLT